MTSSNRIIRKLPQLDVNKHVEESYLLGKGTFSRVRLASHKGELVAVKQFSKEDELKDEVRIQQLLPVSPYLVRTIGMDQCNLIMEYTNGDAESFTNKVEFSLNDFLRIIRDVALGLVDLEHAGIIHRDIKPNNIFLSQKNGLWRGKIADFNVSTTVQDKVELQGTPCYISPEISTQKSHSVKSDIFSYGVFIIALCLGEELFYEEFQKIHYLRYLLKGFKNQESQHIKPCLTFLETIHLINYPKSFREFILKLIRSCLEENPENRPSALTIAESVHEYLVNWDKEEHDEKVTEFIKERKAGKKIPSALLEQKDEPAEVAPVIVMEESEGDQIVIKNDELSVRKQHEFFQSLPLADLKFLVIAPADKNKPIDLKQLWRAEVQAIRDRLAPSRK